MPPREIHRVGERGAADWYTSLPPITRALLTCYFATGLGAYFGVLPLQYLYHSWPLIFKGLPQVWRLLTAYSFLGAPSLRWLFKLVWLVQYGGSYESAKFAHNTADGITCLSVGMMTGLVMDLLSWLCEAFIPPVFSRGFHASSIIFMFLYLWSKQNPEAQVSLFGFVNLNGKHLPFAFLLIDLLVGEDVWGDALGILMGHVYWFLTHAYPLATGRHVIRTPQWLSRACLQYGIGRVPVAAVDMVHPSDVRFRAFQGRGRRLAD